MNCDDLAIPTLPSRSIEATVEFYRALGFVGGAHAFNADYAILTRGSVELHFFLHRDLVPSESAFGCYLRVRDVQAFFQQAANQNLPHSGIPRMDRLEDKPWGLCEFAVVDPDGNLLRIGQVLNAA